MRDILREGMRHAISKLILMPVSVGFLWLLLVHAQVAQVVGLPTPTLPQIALFVLCVSMAV